MGVLVCVAVSPGSNESTKDHSKHRHLNRRREGLSVRRGDGLQILKSLFARARTFLLDSAAEMWSLTYFSNSPSNTMVRKILNLLKTVNMGKLGKKENRVYLDVSYHLIIVNR